jgi:hypothetical protein
MDQNGREFVVWNGGAHSMGEKHMLRTIRFAAVVATSLAFPATGWAQDVGPIDGRANNGPIDTRIYASRQDNRADENWRVCAREHDSWCDVPRLSGYNYSSGISACGNGPLGYMPPGSTYRGNDGGYYSCP